MKKEVITRKKSLRGSTNWNSPHRIGRSVPPPIAARHVVAPVVAAATDSNIVGELERLVISYGMAEKPSLSPFFNDEPLIPLFGTALIDPKTGRFQESVGAIDLDSNLAYVRSLGETVERYCQLYPSENIKLISGNYKEVNAEKPSEFFPYQNLPVNFDKRQMKWCSVQEFKDNRKRLVPARLVYLNDDDYDPELDSIRSTSGAALAFSYDDAVFKGLCELIERDAFFVYYLTRMTPPRIDVSNMERVERLIEYLSRYHLDVNLFDISLDLSPPVIMCIVIDRSGMGPAIGIGTVCGTDMEMSIFKAILDAQQIRRFIRMLNLLDEEVPHDGLIKERALFWYDPKNIEKLNFFLSSEKTLKLESNIEKECILTHFPFDILVADISLPNMDNIKAVKVIVPELVPLYFDDRYPPTRCFRLRKYLKNRESNIVPHPFL